MASVQDELYTTLMKAYINRYRDQDRSIVKHNVHLLWEYMQSISKTDLELGEKVEQKITGLLVDINENKSTPTSSSKTFSSACQTANPGPSNALPSILVDSEVCSADIPMKSNTFQSDSTTGTDLISPRKRHRNTQKACRQRIEVLREELISLQHTYDANPTYDTRQNIEGKIEQLQRERRILQRLEYLTTYQTNRRKKNTRQLNTNTFRYVSTKNKLSSSKVSMTSNIFQPNSTAKANYTIRQKKPRNSQKACQKLILSLQKELNCLQDAYNAIPNYHVKAQIKRKSKRLEQEHKTLMRLKLCAAYQSKLREEKVRSSDNVIGKESNKKHIMKRRPTFENSNSEVSHALLQKTIVDIAMFFSGIDERQRLETISNLKTLDSLHMELTKSSTYLRLMPSNSNFQGGKNHVNAVPVKLAQAETEHSIHIDSTFAAASIRYLENLASLLGPNEVFFLSQDHKSRVAVGTLTADKQAPLLMRLEYHSIIPNHETVVSGTETMKLIPFVYAGMCIRYEGNGEPNAVTYSGPTYISIRKGNHSSSSARLHALDFERLVDLQEFQPLAKTPEGIMKPIVIMKIDGGPDENPQQEKMIVYAIKLFIQYNLDALFVVTDVPGGSAHSRVQRRMAPLNRELANIILPANHFGSSLVEGEYTRGYNSEAKNFDNTGKVLAEVWSSLVIDDHAVKAEYIDFDGIHNYPESIDMTWYENHVQGSQYFLQIVKCQSLHCCDPPRSSLRTILPTGFFPPPIRITQSPDGLEIASQTGDDGNFANLLVRRTLSLEPTTDDSSQISYDFFCPSLVKKSDYKFYKHNDVDDETSNNARPSRRAAKKAQKLIDFYWELENEEAEHTRILKEDPEPEIIEELDQWLTSPWIEDI